MATFFDTKDGGLLNIDEIRSVTEGVATLKNGEQVRLTYGGYILSLKLATARLVRVTGYAALYYVGDYEEELFHLGESLACDGVRHCPLIGLYYHHHQLFAVLGADGRNRELDLTNRAVGFSDCPNALEMPDGSVRDDYETYPNREAWWQDLIRVKNQQA